MFGRVVRHRIRIRSATRVEIFTPESFFVASIVEFVQTSCYLLDVQSVDVVSVGNVGRFRIAEVDYKTNKRNQRRRMYHRLRRIGDARISERFWRFLPTVNVSIVFERLSSVLRHRIDVDRR